MTIEFQAFPKLQRLSGPVIVTEKIDGTNACIIIENGEIAAQSRTRIIIPGKDNFGFATWVHTNKDALITLLGEGRHYGEWWGAGIQRGYGLKQKAFSLFNTTRWGTTEGLNSFLQSGLSSIDVVPVLFTGTFPEVIETLPMIMAKLKLTGSVASPGYMNPEGVVIYDTRSGQGYKKTFDYDDTGKGGQKDEDGNVM